MSWQVPQAAPSMNMLAAVLDGNQVAAPAPIRGADGKEHGRTGHRMVRGQLNTGPASRGPNGGRPYRS